MIAASVVLTVTAAVLFIVGLLKTDGTTIIWASIGASALALASLVAGVLRGRKATPETIGGVPVGEVPLEPAMRESDAESTYASGLEAEPATLAAPVSDLAEEDAWVGEPGATEEEPETTEIATTARRKTTARKPSARKPATRKPAPRKPAPAKKATAKPAARKPAAPKSAAKSAAKSAKPTAKKATAKPAARKPAARKPSTRKSS